MIDVYLEGQECGKIFESKVLSTIDFAICYGIEGSPRIYPTLCHLKGYWVLKTFLHSSELKGASTVIRFFGFLLCFLISDAFLSCQFTHNLSFRLHVSICFHSRLHQIDIAKHFRFSSDLLLLTSWTLKFLAFINFSLFLTTTCLCFLSQKRISAWARGLLDWLPFLPFIYRTMIVFMFNCFCSC